MSHLLRAMGLWIWGLIAIAISVSLVSLSYRTLFVYRPHYSVDAASDTAFGRPQDAGVSRGAIPATPAGIVAVAGPVPFRVVSLTVNSD